jgi:hypothetical protein
MIDDQQPARNAPKRVQLDRYTVSVDRQSKTGFKDRASAEVEAERIRRKHPRVSVEVTDQEGDDIVERADPKPSEADADDAIPIDKLNSANDE